ncbi:MAG: iron-containing alcohol dehydrogenase [Pirellulaceae bacterium]|nr:iron-containing alcohol dehydrogenase [Pirellulaceae bacterium]
MEGIDFQPRTRLVFGPGCVARLGQLALELKATRALVVSDPGVVAAGHFERGVSALRQAGVEVCAFHGVRENPSTTEVAHGLSVAKDFQPNLLVGLGGGSSMDCAKGINFLFSCGGRMEDYWGVGKATGDMLPMIAVPTTSGTGSEAQSFALISQAETHVKMACGDPRAACRIAVLDPELTITQPASVTALTGIDAVSHAIESYVTRKRNPLSACYSREAWQLLSEGFPSVLADPRNLEARSQMQLGAFFAGLAIETSMLGAAHALANPLTARYSLTHGQAVGLMLPHVIRFNGLEMAKLYAQLYSDVPNAQAVSHPEEAVELLAAFVTSLLGQAKLATQLRSCNVDDLHIDQLASEATKQWTGTFNPRPLSQMDFANLYRAAY